MSVYIHIPYCKKACHYCNFHFSTTKHQLKAMIDALCREIYLQKNYLIHRAETIYFGGGTPSILEVADIEKILNAVYRNFSVASNPEITIETNPDDIDIEKLKSWKQSGFNRLSIGTQSFFDEDLAWMNRAHNARQATDSIKMAQNAGFSNITIDLIYGTPTLSNEKWMHNIQQSIDLGIPHLSCYALTVEPKTALHKFIEKNKVPDTDQLKQAAQFQMLMKALCDAGFEHYEISNFAKPDFRSKHNSNYWSGKEYLGIGPSAHSFNGNERQWNIANNALYIQSLHKNIIPSEKEILTEENKINEYIMTSLRTSEGISISYFSEAFGTTKACKLLNGTQRWINKKMMRKHHEHLMLTNNGKLIADGISADLFF